VISVIGLPMTIVTGFFGMNFDPLPDTHSPAGFWISIALKGIAVAAMLCLFHK
jgi:magnesium transporter